MRVNSINNIYQTKYSKKYKHNKPQINHSVNQSSYNTGYYGLSFAGLIPPAKRLQKSDYLISSYIAEISKARNFYGNRTVVDLSMGNPDLTPPEKSKQVLKQKVNDLWSHRYNNPKGEGALLHTVANWMAERFGVKIDSGKEVMATSGSSDAIDHIFTAYANPNDKILVPNPGYSLYDDLITRHDLKKEPYDLSPKTGYLPDFSKMPKDAKILILNYPHNPTGSFASKQTFEEAVKWAKENKVLIIHDMDNSEVTQSGEKPLGILQIEGAKEVAFQVHTMSKSQSMPGFRVAFTVSDKENIDNLLNAKYLSGGSVYVPVQHAAIAALKDEEGYIDKINKIYRSRKNTTIEHLKKLGSDAKQTAGTYYLWVKIPPEFTSNEFFKYILHKSQVAFTPGTVFGSNGEGYVRIVMSAAEGEINKCFERIENAGIRFDIPKSQLPEKIQKEIKKMSDGTYVVEPKWSRDLKDYINYLNSVRDTLTKRFADKDKKFERFIPITNNNLPWNILKDGQSVYVQDVTRGIPLFAKIQDIKPHSSKNEYAELINDIETQWLSVKPDLELPAQYKSLNPNVQYFTLKTDDGKLQAAANIELQNGGIMCGKDLNIAPWNKGEEDGICECETAILARMTSFCLETGNDVLKFVTDKPDIIKMFKNAGMKEESVQNFGGKQNTVLVFDKASMITFLNKYQSTLSF